LLAKRPAARHAPPIVLFLLFTTVALVLMLHGTPGLGGDRKNPAISMDCRVTAIAVRLVAGSANDEPAPVAGQAIFLDSEKLTRQGWDFSRFVKEACFHE
jgi:hypothetical protein